MTVADSTGTIVATGTGTSQDVDWTWDATAAAPGSYSWTIAAGDTVRSATGTHRREGCRPGDPLGDGGSADDHAERRRADRLEPHHVHAQRPRNRDGDVAWSRRARSLRALLASAQTGKADLPLHGGGGCRRPLRDRPERDRRHRDGHDCDSRSRRPNGSRLHRHTGRGVAERRRHLRCAHFRVRAHTSCVGPARRRSGGKDARTRLLRRPPGRSRVRVLEHRPV